MGWQHFFNLFLMVFIIRSEVQILSDHHRELLESSRWARLANEGARPQRLLWASTSTKNPDARGMLYVSARAAQLTINTMSDATLLAYADHGPLGDPMPADGGDAEHTFADFATAGVDQQALAERLQREGVQSFERSGTARWPASPPNTNR